jgi:hypothetical protein
MAKATIAANNAAVSHPACSLEWEQSLEKPQIEPNFWVKLWSPLNSFSHDEALLLCQASDSESRWIVWIPNHGEAVLDISEFVADVYVKSQPTSTTRQSL